MAQRQAPAESAARMDEVSEAESSEWEIDQPQEEPPRPKKKTAQVVVAEKDADEIDIERLVLGDKAGFRSLLFHADTADDAEDYLRDLSLAAVPDEDDADATGLGALDNSNMFFTDDTVLAGTHTAAAATADVQTGADADAPAWEDSDDERLRVSLAEHTRLRKLRRFEGEDIVSGAAYSERLRQQFLRLNPQPEWAVEAAKAEQARARRARGLGKRTRSGRTSGSETDSNDGDDDDDDDEDDGGDDGEEGAFGEGEGALPLDTFFRSAGLVAGASRLQQTGGPSKKRRRLQPETLAIHKTRDMATAHAGPVVSLAFHPRHAVLLSASTSSEVHLHQVAPGAQPTANPLLTAVRLRRLPVRRAAFVGGGGESTGESTAGLVVMAGRRRFFHTWDLATGQVQRISRVAGHGLEQRTMERFRTSPGPADAAHLAVVATDRKGGGMVNVLSVRTMQWVAQARLDSRGGIADVQWWRDGRGLTLLGRDGRVGEWSLAARRFVGIWRDDGSTGGTVLGLGGSGGPAGLGGDRWVAIGSSSGIVNVYERRVLVAPATTATTTEDDNRLPTLVPTPTPTRTFEQLTTPVTQTVFTPDGQLLAFASQYKRDALRLAHLPSCTVYRNWPTEKTPLGRITALAFSRESDLLAVGNDAGKTRLWEIRG